MMFLFKQYLYGQERRIFMERQRTVGGSILQLSGKEDGRSGDFTPYEGSQELEGRVAEKQSGQENPVFFKYSINRTTFHSRNDSQ